MRIKRGAKISIVVLASISMTLANLFPSQGASVLDLLPGEPSQAITV